MLLATIGFWGCCISTGPCWRCNGIGILLECGAFAVCVFAGTNMRFIGAGLDSANVAVSGLFW